MSARYQIFCGLVEADAVTTSGDSVYHERERVIGDADETKPSPDVARTRDDSTAESAELADVSGFIMSRTGPVARSSPSFQRTASVSLPTPSVKSTVSPKMSENDSIQCTRLLVIKQPGRFFGDRMREFMRNDIVCAGKAVAVDQLRPVPERIGIRLRHAV